MRAKVTAVTLNVRKTPSTDAVIVKQAAQEESFPLLESSNGWIKVQLQADASGYISAEYAKSYQFRELRSIQKKKRLLFIPEQRHRQNLLM